MISEGHSNLDQFTTPKQSVPVHLESIHGARTKSFPILDIHIKITATSEHKALSIQCSELNFPLTETNSLLTDINIKFKGESVTVIPPDRDFSDDPSICLGVKYMNHFPERIPPAEYPDRFRREYPHASLYRSQISGNLLIGGNLDSLDQTIMMFGKATAEDEFFKDESDSKRHQTPLVFPEAGNLDAAPGEPPFQTTRTRAERESSRPAQKGPAEVRRPPTTRSSRITKGSSYCPQKTRTSPSSKGPRLCMTCSQKRCLNQPHLITNHSTSMAVGSDAGNAIAAFPLSRMNVSRTTD